MNRDLLLPAANAIHAETMEFMETFVENENNVITPEILDSLESDLYHQIKKQFPEKIGRKFIREQIVSMMLEHYGVEIFGVAPMKPKNAPALPKQITEKTIKKYTKKR